MLKRLPIVPLSLILALVAPLAASAADAAVNRFQIEKTKYGFVRLDGQTGAMIFCREDDEAVACSPASSEASAVEDQVKALEEKVKALETNLKASEERARASQEKLMAAMRDAGKVPLVSGRLPTDKEIDDTFSVFEKFMRKFMDMSRELNQDEGVPQPK